ncbi:hypothetical protein GLOIN_2v1869824 [Rhizophagus irregularis DAOM 181602=DAOM 197198]|uniref:Uncharacterized protein n=1 Tax=Rhizophagus irregularis (strain DAOM 181602 / DAOM 197198 / MUCL 43194) TaxID=747089 RepID=A0A2P4QP37_RHIID|nr:hypothetical protein GLOIN_2v1869824 [Rhizophagus irregularis DAOM 181602=DAOM 197198]POG79396.1 hypothetical protein GLOIN_2v1869824 [Rhizophagus irregularis DAOM 181602=DAOM 197198]|eukprot:XP_025186262.1 hypothetical protein GLOIN_2v1869824 [Rhizophagus irregularis DAOM 181602=DAOM 197198]
MKFNKNLLVNIKKLEEEELKKQEKVYKYQNDVRSNWEFGENHEYDSDDEWFISSKKDLVEEWICQVCEVPLEEGQEEYCKQCYEIREQKEYARITGRDIDCCEICNKFTYLEEVNHVYRGQNTPCVTERAIKEFYCHKGGYMNDHHNHKICMIDSKERKSCYSKVRSYEKKSKLKYLNENIRKQENLEVMYNKVNGPKYLQHEYWYKKWIENISGGEEYFDSNIYQKNLNMLYGKNEMLTRNLGLVKISKRNNCGRISKNRKYHCESCYDILRYENIELTVLPNYNKKWIWILCKGCHHEAIEKNFSCEISVENNELARSHFTISNKLLKDYLIIIMKRKNSSEIFENPKNIENK